MRRPPLAALAGWTLAMLLVAVVVHISSVLLLPRLASRDAIALLAALPANGGLQPLPTAAARGGVPFLDEGTILVACRYDLRARPLRLRLAIDGEALSTVSFHARSGVVFHTLTDRAALRGRLDVLLGLPPQIDVAEAADQEDVPTQEVRLTAPSPDGFVLVRGLASSRSRVPALRRRFAEAECRSEDQ